ncbi:UNVERIFIED_CONTAM: hypothetical protein FKN15_007365 [Acipenser sinensis]
MAVTRRGRPIESITGAEALVESCGDGEPQKKKRATEQSISSSRGEILGSPVRMASNLSDSLTSMDWLPQLNLKGCVKSRSSELGAQTEKGPRGTSKPPFSYATLISQAIKSTPRGRMSLNDIYSWICEQYPFYKNTGAGWKVKLKKETTSPTVIFT